MNLANPRKVFEDSIAKVTQGTYEGHYSHEHRVFKVYRKVPYGMVCTDGPVLEFTMEQVEDDLADCLDTVRLLL